MDKKKIYVVSECCDYCNNYPLRAFLNKNKAELFKKEKEEELKILKERYHNKCCKCAWGDKYCELYKKPTDEESNCDCENRVESYEIIDTYYTIREIEVE